MLNNEYVLVIENEKEMTRKSDWVFKRDSDGKYQHNSKEISNRKATELVNGWLEMASREGGTIEANYNDLHKAIVVYLTIKV